MILVDKNIYELVKAGKLIVEGFNQDHLNGVSYDLSVDTVIGSDEIERDFYDIQPGETVFVKTVEMLSIPNNIIGDVIEKNSRMRQGLRVDAPRYQPGHQTKVFLRVENISGNVISIERGATIAQIYFEELKDVPNVTYDKQAGASYNQETKYTGFGNYKDVYEGQIKKKTEDAKEEIKEVTKRLYADILTLMGILVAVISLITINANAFSKADIDFKFIIVLNLSLSISIAVLMGMIMIFITKAENKKFLTAYIVILAILVAALIGFGICCI